MTRHERRRFVEQIDFVTSPGYLEGAAARKEAGLTFGRPANVLTDLALMDFEPETKSMRVVALQPGVELTAVRENTGFELLLQEPVGRLAGPTPEELLVLRTLDPHGVFLS